MAAVARRRRADSFEIHEDVPSTEDTEMNDEIPEEEAIMEHEEDIEDQESNYSDSSEDEPIDRTVQDDMERLQDCFPRFREKYRLIKRIGEGLSPEFCTVCHRLLTSNITGTFSTVCKAEDLQYEHFVNDWDLDKRKR